MAEDPAESDGWLCQCVSCRAVEDFCEIGDGYLAVALTLQ